MCGRVVYVWDAETGRLIQKLVDVGRLDDDIRDLVEKRRYNVPPSSHLPVVAVREDEPRVEAVRWGFPIRQRPNGVFNARIETAHESSMWRSLIGRSHGLFVVKGFYEWDRKTRVPHYFHRRDGHAMLLGALVGTRTWQQQPVRCASIVTTAANSAVAPLHERMPLVIEEGDAEDWLDATRALDLAMPAGDVLDVHPVSKDVNDTASDHPGLIESTGQQRLS